MSPSPLRHPARRAGESLLRLQSDERLVDLAVDGHEAAFNAIVDRYRTPLTRYCAGLVGPSRAEDVVQQALINAHHALQRTDEVRHLRSWLYRIAHNAALNVLRAVRDDVPLDAASGAAAAADDDPVAAFERSERFRETVDALRDLPERQRAALVLRELEGRSHEEIAESLGVTSGAARQHLMRARVALRGAVTAITPYPLVVRLAEMLASPGAAGWTEAAVGAGTGATLAKLTAGVAATGALVGGAVGTERVVHHHRDSGQNTAQGSTGGSAPKPRRVETRAVSLPAARVVGSTGVPASGSGGRASGSSGPTESKDHNKPERDVLGNDHSRDHDAPSGRGPGGNLGDDDVGGQGNGNNTGGGGRSGAAVGSGHGSDGNDDRRGRGHSKPEKHDHGKHAGAGNGSVKDRGDERPPKDKGKGNGGGKGAGESSGGKRGDAPSNPGRGHKGADEASGSRPGHGPSGSASTTVAPITEPTPSMSPAPDPDPGKKSNGNGRPDKDNDSGSSKGSGASKKSDAD